MRSLVANNILRILRKHVFLNIILIMASGALSAQDTRKSEDGIKNFGYSEMLYVQADRDIYFTGEDVFIKIYRFNALTHTPGNVSKVAYTDLFDNYRNPLIQIKTEINDFSGSAVLRLPDTLSTGNYFIRSYTNWMQNFPAELYSYKRISVINPFEKMSRFKIPSSRQQPDTVIFYPETGFLIQGVENRTGFRCLTLNGDPVKMNGIIINEDNDTLGLVSSDKNGFGIVSITPTGPGNIYLQVDAKTRPGRKYPLPEIFEGGITFTVKSDARYFEIRLNIPEDHKFQKQGDKAFIVYTPVSSVPIRKSLSPAGNNLIILKRDELPYGLALLKVTDEAGNLMAERWIINDKADQLRYEIKIPSDLYSTRERVSVSVNVRDADDKPEKSDLLISVVKSFTSDNSRFRTLARQIQLPAAGAIDIDQQLPDINDCLMFFPLNDELFASRKDFSLISPEYLPEIEGHLVSGTIMERATGVPLQNEHITLSFIGKAAHCSFAKTDDQGNFNFVISNKELNEIVIQPLSADLRDCYIELKDPFIIPAKHFRAAPLYLDSNKLELINKAIISMQVKNIYSPFLNKPADNTVLTSTRSFYGDPDKIIELSGFIELGSLKEVVKEIVPGLSTQKRNDKINFRLINMLPGHPFETSPLVLFDGVPVYDIEKLLDIKSAEIERIEVVNSRYFISDIVLEGIVNFISKKADMNMLDFDKTIFRQEFNALQETPRYYFPDYSADSLKSGRIPDFRNTLYWNPDLSTDSEGNVQFEFYTSDESGEYTVIVEGVSGDGKTGRSATTFRVTGRP